MQCATTNGLTVANAGAFNKKFHSTTHYHKQAIYRQKVVYVFAHTASEKRENIKVLRK